MVGIAPLKPDADDAATDAIPGPPTDPGNGVVDPAAPLPPGPTAAMAAKTACGASTLLDRRVRRVLGGVRSATTSSTASMR